MAKSVTFLFHKNCGFDTNNMIPVSMSLDKYSDSKLIIQNLFFVKIFAF